MSLKDIKNISENYMKMWSENVLDADPYLDSRMGMITKILERLDPDDSNFSTIAAKKLIDLGFTAWSEKWTEALNEAILHLRKKGIAISDNLFDEIIEKVNHLT